MNFPKYNYEINRIKKKLEQVNELNERLKYLTYLIKEIDYTIYIFENTPLRKYCKKNTNLVFESGEALKDFINDLGYSIENEACDEINNMIVDMKHDAETYLYKTNYYLKTSRNKTHYTNLDHLKTDDIMFGIRDFKEYFDEELVRFRQCDRFLKKELDHIKVKIKEQEENIDETQNKIKWNGTKTEYARLIVEEYNSNKNSYRSLKKACEVLFEKYSFDDKKFTVNKCYDLVRKV